MGNPRTPNLGSELKSGSRIAGGIQRCMRARFSGRHLSYYSMGQLANNLHQGGLGGVYPYSKIEYFKYSCAASKRYSL